MELTAIQQTVLASIASRHSTNIAAAILSAYEEGILEGAARVARAFAQQATATVPTTNNDDADDGRDSPLSAHDKASMRADGIDPDKKFNVRGTLFTIVAWKPSRWKFPIVGVNARGTRYKFPIASVKAGQK